MAEEQRSEAVSLVERVNHTGAASAERVDTTRIYRGAFNLTVLVAGLGYLVDTFDFFLYNCMRVVSLTELGLSGEALMHTGIVILNCQILGALIGSFVWGILGDKIGRKKALLGSILIYSLGMFATAFVHDPLSYGVLRFITGFGLGGEVGVGATLVAETVRSQKRTYALMFFTIMGVLGIVLAGVSLEFVSWRTSCMWGGIVGLILLTLRGLLFESQAFMDLTNTKVRRGSLRELFGSIDNLRKYLLCIPLLGANFFVTGILLTLAPEVAKATGAQFVAKANIALAIYFLVAVVGDCLGAWFSECFKSRRLVTGLFVVGNMLLAILLLQPFSLDAFAFYALCATFGVFNLWALAGTILVEQFPTELRSTATTSNLNCSRACVVLMNLTLLAIKPIGIVNALLLIGGVMFALALFCLWRLPETYGKSLTTS